MYSNIRIFATKKFGLDLSGEPNTHIIVKVVSVSPQLKEVSINSLFDLVIEVDGQIWVSIFIMSMD